MAYARLTSCLFVSCKSHAGNIVARQLEFRGRPLNFLRRTLTLSQLSSFPGSPNHVGRIFVAAGTGDTGTTTSW